jgi:hypothetical protein
MNDSSFNIQRNVLLRRLILPLLRRSMFELVLLVLLVLVLLVLVLALLLLVLVPLVLLVLLVLLLLLLLLVLLRWQYASIFEVFKHQSIRAGPS